LIRQTIFTCVTLNAILAVLYDIHGNLPALEQVLADADTAGADHYFLGGDFGAWSPWPRETLERLRALPETTWIRGNGERWLREPPLDRPEVADELANWDPGVGPDQGWLYSLQAQKELDGVVYTHGSPLSDVESFPREPSDDDERLLNGVRDQTVVFGHSHLQFKRPGPNGTTLINPGSAGMPLDGDPRAAYAMRHDDGEFEFRRVEYDTERVSRAWAQLPGWGPEAAQRILKGSD
jgi:predicted phosphodiesterase